MDASLLLVKCITLLYRESLIINKQENSGELVRKILNEIKLPEESLSLNSYKEILVGLKETALKMCESPIEHVQDKTELLQTLKINCKEDDVTYDSLEQAINVDMNESQNKRTSLNLKRSLKDYFSEKDVKELFKKANMDLTFNRDKIDNIRDYVKDFIIKVEPFQALNDKKDPAIVTSVNLSDVDGMEKVFEKVQKEETGGRVLKTGWQAFNRMAGGGIRRGTTTTIAALPHHNKTGFTLSLFRQLAIHNDPVMNDINKKPLMIRLSFEDSTLLNSRFLYNLCYEHKFKEKPVMARSTPKEKAAFLRESLEVKYNVLIKHVTPSLWCYKDIQNLITSVEADGYEVHVLMVDYLSMITTAGCETGPMGHDLQDMFKRMRNFCAAKEIAFITPHQLSNDAKMLIRDGYNDFVKKMPGGGYYKGCKSLDQEVDLEVFIHIEKMNDRSFLTVQRGKHRGVNDTPDKDKYFVLPMPTEGRPILDDIDSEDISISKVGGEKASKNDDVFDIG